MKATRTCRDKCPMCGMPRVMTSPEWTAYLRTHRQVLYDIVKVVCGESNGNHFEHYPARQAAIIFNEEPV